MIDFLWNLFEYLVIIFESFVYVYFVCAFMKHEFSTRKGKFIFVGGSIVLCIIEFTLNYITFFEGLLGIIYSVFTFLYSLFLLKGSILKKMFVSVLANIISMFVSSFVISAVSAMFQDNINQIYTERSLSRFITIIIAQILLVYVYSVILKITSNRELALKKKEWLLIISVFTVSFVALAIIHITQLYLQLPLTATQLLLFSELGIIIVNTVCFYMTIALSKSNRETMSLKILEQQQEQRTQYAESIRKQYEEIRQIRHDVKQNFAVINALLEEQKPVEAKKFVEKCTNTLSKLDIVMDVGNDFVNAILNSKLNLAKEKGINIICSSSNDVAGVEDIDLCILLGNMLDNAIEASEKSEEKSIEASILSDDSTLFIKVVNTVDKPVLQHNPDLRTIKSDKNLHGYGIKTIISVAEKYNGYVDFYEEDKQFCCSVTLHKLK